MMYAGDEFYDDDVTSGVGTSYPNKRSGAEPSGVTPVRAADGPGATSSDGGSPETERAMSNVDSPDRITVPSEPLGERVADRATPLFRSASALSPSGSATGRPVPLVAPGR